MSKRVLILGGYGVFGGRLARLLIKDSRFEVLVAGRAQSKAQSFCKTHGGTPVLLNLAEDDLDTRIAALSPFIVIDAVGPFQAYKNTSAYRLAKAAIACGAHYLDLSDDAVFTSGIIALDDSAKKANVSVFSGVSSVPALSSSIISSLSSDMAGIHHIESATLPGNKAPRGLSVIRAITTQAGKPMKIWKNNQWIEVKGWSRRKRITLNMPGGAAIKNRWASLIGAPDLQLFPQHFKARSVAFRAGLDLKLMHGGLAFLSMPVRWGWLKSITTLSPLLKWAADRLEPLGSDRGGMLVQVTGTMQNGAHETRLWTLIVKGGDGPFIPAIPAQIMCVKLLAGGIAPGASSAIDVFAKAEVETAFSTLDLKTHVETTKVTPLFTSTLGKGFEAMPNQLQELHTVLETRRWVGKAEITRGTGLLSRLAGRIANFPPASKDTDVEVTMARTSKGETWTRHFGKHTFRSHLSQKDPTGNGKLFERFGLLKFTIGLAVKDQALHFPVTHGTCLGIPIPRFLLPKAKHPNMSIQKAAPVSTSTSPCPSPDMS